MKNWKPMKVSVVGAVTEVVLGSGRRSGRRSSHSQSQSNSSWSEDPA